LINPFEYERTNILGTLNILELMKEFKIRDFIFASGSSVYGGNEKIPFSVEDKVDKPISLYGVTKRANELMAYTYHKLYGFNCIGLRFFTVYGPWGRPDMAYFKFTRNISRGQPIEVYNYGHMKRDFTYIDDIAEGTIKSLKPVGYEIINLGSDHPVKLSYVISLIEDALGKKAKIKYLPRHAADVFATRAEIKKARELLSWQPKMKIEEGIKRTIEWFLENWKWVKRVRVG